MKIIAENEKEKDDILKLLASSDYCPGLFSFNNNFWCDNGDSFSQCFNCWKNSCFEIEITAEKAGADVSLISREKILEKRCERYREIICELCHVEDTANDLLVAGKLSPNDARYLMGLVEVDTAEGLNGYPELFTDCNQTVAAEKKPPLGIMPRWIWERKRCREIAEAIDRYTYAEKPIPAEWIEEYNELVGEANRRS